MLNAFSVIDKLIDGLVVDEFSRHISVNTSCYLLSPPSQIQLLNNIGHDQLILETQSAGSEPFSFDNTFVGTMRHIHIIVNE